MVCNEGEVRMLDQKSKMYNIFALCLYAFQLLLPTAWNDYFSIFPAVTAVILGIYGSKTDNGERELVIFQ